MKPRHISEDDLTLYYYGEGARRARIEHHLQECPSCAALYREISGTLAMVTAEEVPERGEQYGLEVWQRIRHRLPEREAGWGLSGWFSEVFTVRGLTLAGATIVLIIGAFVAGQFWQHPVEPQVATSPSPVARSQAASANSILLASVADHLDRSERVLTDIMNAPDAEPRGSHEDISATQRWAEDLVTASRLYRQDAMDAGEQSIAGVLDDLERNLLEIVHSPSKITGADLEQIRRRIDAAALLFKVRVMSDELRRRESAAERSTPQANRPSPSSTSKTS